MVEKTIVERLGYDNILSEMEKIQVYGGGIGGNGGTHISCSHIECVYNSGCVNDGCGTNTGNCSDTRCSFYTQCGVRREDLNLIC